MYANSITEERMHIGNHLSLLEQQKKILSSCPLIIQYLLNICPGKAVNSLLVDD